MSTTRSAGPITSATPVVTLTRRTVDKVLIGSGVVHRREGRGR